MVEQVKDRTLYHMTVTKPYKKAFVANQVVRVGDAYNPFFGFYEGSRQYLITDSNTGDVIQVNAITWLKRVQEGTINTTPEILACLAVEVTQHYVMLCRELIMEEVRRDEFNSEPSSRQNCLYVCDTIEEAHYWKNRINENGTVCELTCTGTIHRADARFLLSVSEPISVTKDRARTYWHGDVSDNPELETLFVGDATVTNFGL